MILYFYFYITLELPADQLAMNGMIKSSVRSRINSQNSLSSNRSISPDSDIFRVEDDNLGVDIKLKDTKISSKLSFGISRLLSLSKFDNCELTDCVTKLCPTSQANPLNSSLNQTVNECIEKSIEDDKKLNSLNSKVTSNRIPHAAMNYPSAYPWLNPTIFSSFIAKVGFTGTLYAFI